MFLDIRKGEAILTLLMFFYYYLVLVTYYLLKPARDSLFLVKLGAQQLPLVFILTALIIAPITTLYSQASRSLRLSRLIYVTSAILIANLIVLRWLLELDSSWVFYVFYIWVSIYGALVASQYWLFANAVYDPAQGKRLFALLNLGGILGAMTGGEVTSLIVKHLGVETEDLLYFCMAFIVGFTVIAATVWQLVMKHRREGVTPKRRVVREKATEKFTDMFAMIKRSRHLLYLVGIIALTMATASFVDYQFKTVSVQSFPEKQALTSFLGTFYGRLSLVSLLLQMFLTYRILRVVGVTGIVMFLPMALLMSSVAMLVYPGLIAGIFLRGSDGAFKYSVDKTGRELLFLPVPLEVKKRTKIFIDVFVDRWFRGLAGAGLLLCTLVFGLTVRQLSIVVISMLAVWVTLVILIRKEYVNAFRSALSRREIDATQLTVNLTDAATVRTLKEALRSHNEREIGYALRLLLETDDESLVEELMPLLGHDSVEIRRDALQLVSRLAPDGAAPEIKHLIRDDDPTVRLAAIRFIDNSEGSEKLAAYLRETPEVDFRVKASEIRFRAEKFRSLDGEVVAGLCQASRNHPNGEEVRIEVARAIGALGSSGTNTEIRDVVSRLLTDPSDCVVAEAIVSMGQTRARYDVPKLIDFLSDRRRREFARRALVEYGDSVVGTLSDVLGDERSDISIRRYVPVVLSRIPTQKSVDALASNLTAVDSSIRFRILKALNKLRQRYPDLKIRGDAIDNAFVEEAKIYYEIMQISALQKNRRESEADELLARALDERLNLNLERIFRLLGLSYPPKDIYSAYLGLVSMQKDRHASAIEFLDNVVGKNVKKYLFPIIDRISETVAIKRGQELFGSEVKTRSDALLKLVDGPDSWLKTCALYCVTADDTEEVKQAALRAVRDRDPIVSETAELVRKRIA